jgi:hypothetical protein
MSTNRYAEIPGPDFDDIPTCADQIRSRLLTTEQLRQLPPPAPLIAGWLNLDSLAMVYGPSGAGKTHLAIDLSMSIASKRFWHGHSIHNGPVLYVIAEGVNGAAQRAAAWEAHHDTTASIMWHPGPINIYDVGWASGLAEVVGEDRPALVVIDTYARATVGIEENGTHDTGIVIDNLDMIRNAAGSCVLVVHHAGKDATKGARGSTALKAAMDTEIEVTGSEGRITVRNTKQKDGPEASPLHFQLVGAAESVVIEPVGVIDDGDLPESVLVTLESLREIDVPDGVPATAWKVASDIEERKFYRHRSKLVNHGLVTNVGTEKTPKYRPTDALELTHAA